MVLLHIDFQNVVQNERAERVFGFVKKHMYGTVDVMWLRRRL